MLGGAQGARIPRATSALGGLAGEAIDGLGDLGVALALVLPLLFVAIPLPARRIDRDRERDGAGDRRGAERGEDRCLGR